MDADDLEREVERTREGLARYSGVHPLSLGPRPEPLDADISNVMAQVWGSMVAEQMRATDLLFVDWLRGPKDGWPKRWVLVPWADRLEQRAKRERNRLRYMRREVHEWWRARPTWLGGDGMPDSF